ncbi:metalloprotease MEP2 [Crepidotus variabilis]|uniref:Extracellular metalloproteinase n=1 Tax=Crepidotus variabilis TaxID=179855 RepID=A0A9P6E7M0_9AGAR|nr:metalloprotease MEP2 [Crepidotus variabilis]
MLLPLGLLLSCVQYSLIPAAALPAGVDDQLSFNATWEDYQETFLPGFFQPSARFEVYNDGLEFPTVLANQSVQELAVKVTQDLLGVDSEVVFISGYSSDVADYAYLAQAYDNIPFVNAVANLALKEGKLSAFGSSFVQIDNIPSSVASMQMEDAISIAESVFSCPYNGHPVKMEYYAKADGNIALVHVIQVQNTDSWYEVYIDAHSGEAVGSTNFVASAVYRAVDIRKSSIANGASLIRNPQDKAASPLGWHNRGRKVIPGTLGNNVQTYIGRPSNIARASRRPDTFNYVYNVRQTPYVGQNPSAARVNAFYVMNTVHDFTYRYGFTEKAFNFQFNNFKKGGRPNDPVLLHSQNRQGLNNANFMTPPDGQSGICNMYVWTTANPHRDSDMDNDILVHEMTHGVSNRMTGGGTGRCLQTLEARGLGEGWSDAMADWTQQQRSARVVDFPAAAYSGNNRRGIRKYPYSTNRQINPHTYAEVRTSRGEHAIGEIWATALHDVYAALVRQHGFDARARTNPRSTKGNAVFLHLFLDALPIQRCNPTFLIARNAWLQADKNRYRGRNNCLLWRTFAARGMGTNAAGAPTYKGGFAVPPKCRRRRRRFDVEYVNPLEEETDLDEDSPIDSGMDSDLDSFSVDEDVDQDSFFEAEIDNN